MSIKPQSAFLLLCLMLNGINLISTGCKKSNPVIKEPRKIPLQPAQNDTSFSVSGLREWYTFEKSLGKNKTTLQLEVKSPVRGRYLEIWIDETLLSLSPSGDSGYLVDLSLDGINPGKHRLMLALADLEQAFFSDSFIISAPLFILVSCDWDTSDNPSAALELQDTLHGRHPGLQMTQFVGPYLFTDPLMSRARQDSTVAWLLRAKAFYGDEIGLHIHARCHFLQSAGVACRSTPSWYFPNGDSTGLSLFLHSFTTEELEKMLRASDSLFTVNGLPIPRSFRAGGWTADLPVIRALARHGFKVDGSAPNPSRLKEETASLALYAWMDTAWHSISDTSQPFTVIDTASGGALSTILEVPDNGALIQYVSVQEMVDIFRKNLGDSILLRPRQVSYVFHAEIFDRGHFESLNAVLDHIDRFLLSRDAGPVVYGTMEQMSGMNW